MIKTSLSFLLLLMVTLSTATASSWNPWKDTTPLLTINNQEYQTTDFINWWYEWRENNQAPTSIDPYIDWILLSTEAAQMQLDDQPRYQKKLATFLRVRSLMLLKNEEIDSKVIPANDKTLYEYYTQSYAPRWQLQTITFRNKSDLEKFTATHAATPEMETKEILTKIATPTTDYTLSSPLHERPHHLPGQILRLLQEAKKQRFSAPYEWSGTWQIIEILALEPASKQDFATLSAVLKPQYLKQQRANLTAKLVQQLKTKYKVKIDEELLASIDQKGAPEEKGQQTVLQFLSHQISAQELHAAANKQYRSLSTQQKSKTPFSQTLQQVLSAIISQNLVDTEALDRHYELKQPFKKTYDFYRNHRLIRELEQQVIQPKVKAITAAEVKQAYEKNKLKLAGAMSVEIVRGETTDVDLATRLQDKLRRGESFTDIMSVLGNKGAKSETIPLSHLSPGFQAALNKLQPGQTDMVVDGDRFTFVRLIKIPQQKIAAFDSIKTTLEAELKRGAFLESRQEIIQQLRQHSTISIDQKQWQSCLSSLKE